MGLVGSLDDLALSELLQIIGLARKSGVLSLRGAEGEGRIVLQDGLVRGAVLPGGPMDLREVLVAGGVVGKEDFDSAEAEASRGDEEIETILIQRGVITEDRLEAVLGDSVETSVIQLLGWESGEFSLDARDACEPGDPKVLTAMGLHTQYLMMEATRLSDEARSRPPSDETEGTHETGEPPTREMKRPALPDPVPEEPPATAATPSPAERPVVVIDSHLDALEWTKQTLSQVFLRVHVFQHPDHALSRIRQYLAGGALPLVLVSCGDGRGDSSKGIGNPRAFVVQLKAQASRTLVVWLATAGAPAPRSVSPADGIVTRPASSQLSDPNATARNQPLAEQLRTDLLECVARNRAAEGVDR